jgi:hypothetical protein
MRKAILPVVLLASLAVAQQPGSVNLSFNATELGYGAGHGPVMNTLIALAVQADGGVLIGGSIERDRDVILQTIGGTVPTVVRMQQVP